MPQIDDLVQATDHLHKAAVLKAEAQQKLDEARRLLKEAERLGPEAGPAALAGAVAAQAASRKLRTEAEGHQRAALTAIAERTD